MAKRSVVRGGKRVEAEAKPGRTRKRRTTRRRASSARGAGKPSAATAVAKRKTPAAPPSRRGKAAAKKPARKVAPVATRAKAKAAAKPAGARLRSRAAVSVARPRTARAHSLARRGAAPGWQAAYAEMQRSARGLEASIGDVRDGLRHAESRIREQAKERILGLRKDVAGQVRGLRERQREAVGKIDRVRGAAGESWVEIRRSFDAIVSDARATAASVAARLRRALLS